MYHETSIEAVMIIPKRFQVVNGWRLLLKWRILLKDLGINPANVLRRAKLPEDLFLHEGASLSTPEYFNLWRAVEEESKDPLLPLKIGSYISAESFAPPVFAALCSPNLNTALARLSLYKRLVCPVALLVDQGPGSTSLEIRGLEIDLEPPASLVTMELVYFVQLARLATRERIEPLRLTSPQPPQPAREYAEYFGAQVRPGKALTITFSAEDAARPFLTANEGMWQFFEPTLNKRLFDLDTQATVSEKVRAALLEMLPGGNATLNAVSSKLGFSPRTLHRRLNEEGVSFQIVLSRTREELAKHYLGNSTMSGSEISFLLGYEDPNSFFRAFQQWTGQSPERARKMLQLNEVG